MQEANSTASSAISKRALWGQQFEEVGREGNNARCNVVIAKCVGTKTCKQVSHHKRIFPRNNPNWIPHQQPPLRKTHPHSWIIRVAHTPDIINSYLHVMHCYCTFALGTSTKRCFQLWHPCYRKCCCPFKGMLHITHRRVLLINWEARFY